MIKIYVTLGILTLTMEPKMAAADPLLPNVVEVHIYRGRPTPDQIRNMDYSIPLEMVEQLALNPEKPEIGREIVCSGAPCPERDVGNTIEIVGPVWHQKIRWTRRDGNHRIVSETPVEYRDDHYASHTLLFRGIRVTMTGRSIFYMASPLCPAFGQPTPLPPAPRTLPPRSSVP